MWNRIAIAVLIIAATTRWSAAAPPEATPAGATTAFYGLHLRLKPMGVPDAGQRGEMRRHLSPGLDALLAAADAAETRYAEKTKKEVPPIVQGDLFTSLFEGASRFAVASCTGDDKAATCVVDFVYQESKGGPESKWQDRALLVRSGERWVIDDIAYGGNWPFARGGRLTDTLKAVVRDADK